LRIVADDDDRAEPGILAQFLPKAGYVGVGRQVGCGDEIARPIKLFEQDLGRLAGANVRASQDDGGVHAGAYRLADHEPQAVSALIRETALRIRLSWACVFGYRVSQNEDIHSLQANSAGHVSWCVRWRAGNRSSKATYRAGPRGSSGS
jgi:hypothetical protein